MCSLATLHNLFSEFFFFPFVSLKMKLLVYLLLLSKFRWLTIKDSICWIDFSCRRVSNSSKIDCVWTKKYFDTIGLFECEWIKVSLCNCLSWKSDWFEFDAGLMPPACPIPFPWKKGNWRWKFSFDLCFLIDLHACNRKKWQMINALAFLFFNNIRKKT